MNLLVMAQFFMITLINDRFFYIENIYFYCGNSMLNKSFNYKFDIYLQLFNKICQKSFVKNDIIFTTPIVDNNYDKILKLTETLPYKTYGFRFINPYLSLPIILIMIVYLYTKI